MSIENGFLDMFVQQGRNVVNNSKDLVRIAGKKGNDRGALIERFTANHHSFNVYTYANEQVKQSEEVQAFKEKLVQFGTEFNAARFDFDGEVNVSRVEELYPEVLTAFNNMVIALGYEKEVIKK